MSLQHVNTLTIVLIGIGILIAGLVGYFRRGECTVLIASVLCGAFLGFGFVLRYVWVWHYTGHTSIWLNIAIALLMAIGVGAGSGLLGALYIYLVTYQLAVPFLPIIAAMLGWECGGWIGVAVGFLLGLPLHVVAKYVLEKEKKENRIVVLVMSVLAGVLTCAVSTKAFQAINRYFSRENTWPLRPSRTTVLLGAVIALIAYIVFRQLQTKKEKQVLRRLTMHMNEYINIPALKQSNEQPYINGKILPINRFVHLECTSELHTKTIHQGIWGCLPKQLRASYPEEVGTIVWLDWEKQLLAKYEGGLSAYVSVCRVTIIDKEIPAIIHRRTFKEKPPDTIEERLTGISYSGSPLCPSTIGDYLKSIPSKKAAFE